MRRFSSPVTVGGHHAHELAVALEERAREVRAGVVGAHRVLGLADEIPDGIGVELHEVGPAGARQGREVVTGHAGNFVFDLSAANLCGVVRPDGPLHVALGQVLDDVEERPRSHRHRAPGRHLRLHGRGC